MGDSPSLTARLKERARQLGFGPVGVAAAAPLAGAAFLARWLAAGCAGQMHYLRRHGETRADPRRLLPGARSVLCVGLHYGAGTSDATGPLDGRLARYARGDDYHDLMKRRLADLWDFAAAGGGRPRGRCYVDTAPVLERELAQRAGLGWRGKNTCLIHPREGSWFLLGGIVTDLELEPDLPAVDRCGTCTRCLEACPTGALAEPYLLDARRCIAYLTIELTGPIPEELRPHLGRWILGCDRCQEVCPWNRRAAPCREPALGPRPGLDPPYLPELLSLDRDAFAARFRGHAGKRPKRRGLLRNATVALGNCGAPEAVPPLVRALQDEEPLVRGHAAWALGQLGGEEARRALREAAGAESDGWVRQEIEAALRRRARKAGGRADQSF